jgi:hypothetical protein
MAERLSQTMGKYYSTHPTETYWKDRKTMSNIHTIQTLIEYFIVILLIYGFTQEDKFIEFEQNIKRIVIGNYRRCKRLRKEKFENDF